MTVGCTEAGLEGVIDSVTETGSTQKFQRVFPPEWIFFFCFSTLNIQTRTFICDLKIGRYRPISTDHLPASKSRIICQLRTSTFSLNPFSSDAFSTARCYVQPSPCRNSVKGYFILVQFIWFCFHWGIIMCLYSKRVHLLSICLKSDVGSTVVWWRM